MLQPVLLRVGRSIRLHADAFGVSASAVPAFALVEASLSVSPNGSVDPFSTRSPELQSH